MLEELDRDLKAVRKAREALGDRAPAFGRGDRSVYRDGRHSERGGSGLLGKRRRGDAKDMESDDSDIPEDVKAIPMPRDTPPPIPKEALDRWYQARRERRGSRQSTGPRQGTGANSAPLGEPAGRGAHFDGLPTRTGTGNRNAGGVSTPRPEAKTVYEAAPVIRDLRKEAVSRFLPSAVRAKIEKVKGGRALVEPEEAEVLEREGYFGAGSGSGAAGEEGGASSRDGESRPASSQPSLERRNPRAATVENPVGDEGDD